MNSSHSGKFIINNNDTSKIQGLPTYNISLRNNFTSKMKRLTIGVFTTTASEKYRRQVIACKDTWVPECEKLGIDVLFFGGYYKDPNVEVINLPGCEEDYNSATMKQYKMLWWLVSNKPSSYYLILGSDNYVVPDRLLKFLNNLKEDEEYHIGGDGAHRVVSGKNTYFHSGGGGIILSLKTAGALVSQLNIEKELELTEPTFFKEWKNLVSSETFYNLIPACDVSLAYYINKYYPECLTLQVKGFYGTDPYRDWNNGSYPSPYKQIDWRDIIVCHYMDPGSMKHFHRYTRYTGREIPYRGFVRNRTPKEDDYSDWCILIGHGSQDLHSSGHSLELVLPHIFSGLHWKLVGSGLSLIQKIQKMKECDTKYVMYLDPEVIQKIEVDTPQFERILRKRLCKMHYGKEKRGCIITCSKMRLRSKSFKSKDLPTSNITTQSLVASLDAYVSPDSSVLSNYFSINYNPQYAAETVRDMRVKGEYSEVIRICEFFFCDLGKTVFLKLENWINLIDDWYISAFFRKEYDYCLKVLSEYEDLRNMDVQSFDKAFNADHTNRNCDFLIPKLTEYVVMISRDISKAEDYYAVYGVKVFIVDLSFQTDYYSLPFHNVVRRRNMDNLNQNLVI